MRWPQAAAVEFEPVLLAEVVRRVAALAPAALQVEVVLQAAVAVWIRAAAVLPLPTSHRLATATRVAIAATAVRETTAPIQSGFEPELLVAAAPPLLVGRGSATVWAAAVATALVAAAVRLVAPLLPAALRISSAAVDVPSDVGAQAAVAEQPAFVAAPEFERAAAPDSPARQLAKGSA